MWLVDLGSRCRRDRNPLLGDSPGHVKADYTGYRAGSARHILNRLRDIHRHGSK
jgi:hypothetical protein